jgi:hypothetical protein
LRHPGCARISLSRKTCPVALASFLKGSRILSNDLDLPPRYVLRDGTDTQDGRKDTVPLFNLPCGESHCTSSGCAPSCLKHSLMRRHVLCDMRRSICGVIVYHGTRRVHTDPHDKLSRCTVTPRPSAHTSRYGSDS